MSIKTVSIFGCGWLGEPLALKLIENGYEVKGSTTSTFKTQRFNDKGIVPFVLFLETENSNENEFLKADLLIIAIPSKNKNGFKRLISQIEKSNIRHVIFISSTSVYPLLNRVVDEQDVDIEKPLSTIENLFRENSKFNSTIIRFAGLYGGDRSPCNWFPVGRKIPHPEGFVNLIHRDDCIAIIEQIIQQNFWNETFNACSPHHPKRRAFYTKVKLNAGFKSPKFIENSPLEFKIVSIKKLIQKLKYSFIYEQIL